MKDATGTVHTITGDQAQAQAATLKQFCAQSTAANYAFTTTSETTVDGPSHVLVTETNNGTEPAQLSATKGDDVSSTDSVDISATLGGSIAGIVDASVTGSYGHTWSTGHSFTTGVGRGRWLTLIELSGSHSAVPHDLRAGRLAGYPQDGP